MRDVLYIENIEQAQTLLKPLRVELIRRLGEPRTCPELADYFDSSAQKIYYHVKALETAGLVDKVDERRVRGVVEGYYQAKARSYWLAPALVGQIGGSKRARDQMSLRVLLELAENVQRDIGRLGAQSEAGVDVPSLSLSAQIGLVDAARRADFMREVQDAFQAIARKYGIPNDDADRWTGQTFKLVLACYPSSLKVSE